MLKYTPAVFAVGDHYQIMVPVSEPSLFWIEIDGKCYYDEQNGIMRSLCTTHRVRVPMSVLDAAKRYVVCERVMIDRKPYFPESAEPTRQEFSFRPLAGDTARIYHVADTHNKVEEPVLAAKQFGDIDLLVMNGDIPNHSGEIAYFDTIYEIAEKLTEGRIPIVFARGNHDMRGYYAERIADHTPNQNGNTYYSFRLGSVWGLVLDCGEDKGDEDREYGFTVACRPFRERQTEYIKEIIQNKATEYEAEGIAHKLIICHNPFTFQLPDPFNIEKDIYTEWARLIKENIKPELMLCGHLHRTEICEVGGEMDHLGQPCRLVVGSNVSKTGHTGCGIILCDGKEPQIKFYTGERVSL